MKIADQLTAMQALCDGRMAELQGPLLAVCHAAMSGGRNVRAALIFAAAPEAGDTGVRAAAALEIMHTATLLQDDIFDGAHLRRGRTAVHVAFGKALAILASDWLLLTSLELAAQVGPAYFRSLSYAGKAMAQAEAAELVSAMPSSAAEAERMGEEIARGKTGRLFGAALCGAALLRGAPESVCEGWEQFGTEIGVTYQIVDDCVDAYSSEERCGKNVGHDLAAGCLTMPTLLRAAVLPGQAETASDAVRALLHASLERRLQKHRETAGRIGLTGLAWDGWLEDLRRRGDQTLVEPETATPFLATQPVNSIYP